MVEQVLSTLHRHDFSYYYLLLFLLPPIIHGSSQDPPLDDKRRIMGGSELNDKKKPDPYIRGSFALPFLEQGGLYLENLSFINKTG